jgi:hypothetical protein
MRVFIPSSEGRQGVAHKKCLIGVGQHNRMKNVQESSRFRLDAECKLRHATQQKKHSRTSVRNIKLNFTTNNNANN